MKPYLGSFSINVVFRAGLIEVAAKLQSNNKTSKDLTKNKYK